jgi:hypothetical protein
MSVSACLFVLVCQLPGARVPLTDLQATLDALPSGATVTIPSGNYGRTVVRKPLTLIGEDPAPTLDKLELDGVAGGRVTLVNLKTASDLVGRGFDELCLFEFEIAAGRLHVDGLQYLELTRLAFTPNALGDISAPGASVLLLDSVAGSLAGRRLVLAGSACFHLAPTEFAKTLQNDLVLAQPARLGKPFTLSWSVPGPAALLLGRASTQAPLRVPHAAAGYWHLAGARWLTATVFSPGALSTQVPADPVLLGMQVSFQVISPRRYFSRPVTAVLR